MHRTVITLMASAAAAGLAGCGITNPYEPHHGKAPALGRTVTTATEAEPTTTTTAGAVAPRALLSRYATLSINWTSATLADRQRQLAGMAVGGARAQALQTAASYGAGSTLQRSRVADHGEITSIAAGEGPRHGWWVITTQETTTGTGEYQGLPAQAHVYAAQLVYTIPGVAVSTWSPQN
jgi:hypothetical protein